MQKTFLHYVFDETLANRAIRFVERCCYLSKGSAAGKPLKLRPWQREIISNIFGWIDPSTGLRRYRRVFIFLPRKNGKSHLAAAIALYMLFADGEKGAEVILAANSRDQASIVYKAAAGMVNQSPVLKQLATPIPSSKRIPHLESDSVLKVISAEAPTALGLDISALIYDEVAFAPSRDLYDALTTASGSRKQPLHVFITTAGWDHEGVGHELYKYAHDVLADPKHDPTFYPVLFEVPANEDWSQESIWHTANPALGDFLNVEEIRNQARSALNNTADQNKFRTFHCNQWVQAAESWLDRTKWDGLANRQFNLASLRDVPCYIGLDLSSNQDLTAVVPLWIVNDTTFYAKPFLFLPEADLRERILRDKAPYDAWVEQGNVFLTTGATVDYSFISKKIHEIASTNTVKAIGYDPWQAHKLIGDLSNDGFTCVKLRQGHETLGAPTKELESLIVSKRLIHDGNACMSWQVGNVTVRKDANGNIVPDKRKSAHRIDGIAATVMALACAMKMNAAPEKKAAEFRVRVLG